MKKRNIAIWGTLIAMLLLLLTTGCDLTGGSEGNSGTAYAIGDTGPSGVGIVFFVTDGGLHGYEVAPDDQSTSLAWSNIFNVEIGTTGTAIGTGFLNTDAIISQSGHTTSAAQVCRNYRAVEEGNWFLPSKDELDSIWVNLVDNGSGDNNGVDGFSDGYYWSSSEIDTTTAWSQDYTDGNQNLGSKFFTSRVRAIRAF